MNQEVERFEHEKEALDSLLTSGVFARAPTLERLLRYLCQKHFEGSSDELKEYTIAVEALGRPAGFDPEQNSIVRVEIHRLRKLLDRYYSTKGADLPVRIAIPLGQYAPCFLSHPESSPSGRETPDLRRLAPAEDVESPGGGPRASSAWTNRRSIIFLAAAAAASAALITFFGAPLRGPGLREREAQLLLGAAGRGLIDRPPSGEAVRILAGGTQPNYVDRSGRVWHGDEFFRGGQALLTSAGLIHRTRDPYIYQTRREGDFSYEIPLKPGCYELHLHFAETIFGPGNIAGGGEGTRVFQVTLNGKPILSEFDIISDAGGPNIALEKVFRDVAPASDGVLRIGFLPLYREKAILSGIEVLPSTCGLALPVRIVCQDRAYTDSEGRLWDADRYFMGGQLINRPDPISGAKDSGVYKGERYGHFNYEIPVPAGLYSVTLHFSEHWFGPTRPGGGGQKSRIFDVYYNGTKLLDALDISSQAGGSGRALVKTFRGLKPNAQGKIALAFVPIVNYASLNAIEVVDQGGRGAFNEMARIGR